MAVQNRLQQQCELEQLEVNRWKRRAQLAHQKGNEYLTREALIRKHQHAKTLKSLQDQLEQDSDSFKLLKKNLALLETKIAEAKMMRDCLKARIAAAQANGQLQSTVGQIGANSAMGAFERMEERVLQLEARSQASAELAGIDLESQFAMLEASSDVDDELAEMKAQVLGSAQRSPSRCLHSDQSDSSLGDTAFDAELEELKRSLDQL